MKIKTKRIISSVLAFSMMLSAAFTDHIFTNEQENIHAFTIEDDVVATDDYTMKYSIQSDNFGTVLCINKIIPSKSNLKSITIPEEIEGYPVKRILDRCFENCKDTETINLPSCLETIDDFAFSWCTGLKDISIPDSVKEIGSFAFYECSSLTSVKLPDQLQVISERLFYDCSSLKNITLPENTRIICDEAFAYTKIENLVIPESVDCLYDIFTHAEKLRSITISPYFHDIEPYLIPENLEIRYSSDDIIVEDGIVFSKDMTKLINYPRYLSTDYYEYTVPSTVEEIKSNAFSKNTISKITFPENLKYIGASAFADCKSLISVDYNGSCPELSGGIFEDCTSLTELMLPDGITEIPYGAFKGCDIYTAKIPESVKIIGSQSMQCGLDSVYIPSSVETIYSNAFSSSTAICGEKGTAAEEYARTYSLRFVCDSVFEPENANINRDKDINILDLIYLKNQILNNDSYYEFRYDINDDHVLNTKDYVDLLDFFIRSNEKKGYSDIQILKSETDPDLKDLNLGSLQDTFKFITRKKELEEFFCTNCRKTSDVNSYMEKYQDYLNDYVISILNISEKSNYSIKGLSVYSMAYEYLFSDKSSCADRSMYTVLVPRKLYWGQKIRILPAPKTYSIDKPVIYLYPEEETKINVKLITDKNTQLSTTYPKYPENEGWTVTAEPDSTLYDKNGREYSYLFWDAYSDKSWDMSEGFVVKGEDTVEFLQDKLEYLGLTPKEYNDFIVYWLPKMEKNKYNLITFQTDDYEERFKLEITPKPDSVQRVFMTYKALNEYIDIPEQTLKPFKRHGYSVIEWGGSEV